MHHGVWNFHSFLQSAAVSGAPTLRQALTALSVDSDVDNDDQGRGSLPSGAPSLMEEAGSTSNHGNDFLTSAH